MKEARRRSVEGAEIRGGGEERETENERRQSERESREDGDRRREAMMGREGERNVWWAKEPDKCTRPRARLKIKLKKPGSPGAENGKAEQERPQGHSVPAGHL